MRPHGVRGSVRARSTGETLGALHVGETVFIGGVERELASVGGTTDRPILAFVGVESREDAAALAQAPIEVGADRLPEVDDETYYVRDLVGCRVLEGAHELGTVVEVETAPANDLLVVEGEGGRVLVALVSETIVSVDLEQRTIGVVEGRAVAVGEGG